MKTIQCPSLLMVGADSPLHLPLRAKEMADRIPNGLAHLESFEGCGAPVYKDNPDKAFSVVRDFLLRVGGDREDLLLA